MHDIDKGTLRRSVQAVAARTAMPDSIRNESGRLIRDHVWAGRYPVAVSKRDYVSADKQNPDELLDFGSANPCMRNFFERARQQLESQLPQPIENRFGSLVVMRQPGT